jgi:Cu(I)/Ag(I) efflux system membrane fusion protein
VEGYVEKLYVDKNFTVVHQGDPLAEIYSPELYSTAQELILATQRKGIGSLAASAREKLRLYGVSPQEIDAIVASGRGAPRLVIRSPQTGYVVGKKIVEGAAVEAKMTLFEVADLSTVWVEADVYEKDIPYLRPGQKVEANVEAYPNRTFAGRLALVYPQLDAATRTNRVRFELQNPQHELRPGMFATVRINTPLDSVEPFKTVSEFLCVPEQAVVDTGTKKVVYVERNPGVFEGVEVELGPRDGQYYPVVKGLKPGDRVAAAGGFLIDAETRLNPAAASTYFGASGGPQSADQASVPISRNGAESASQKSGPARFSEQEMKNINQLPEADRPLALAQRTCPITGAVLGSMGVPVKIVLRGQPVFLCCKGCVDKTQNAPDETLKKVDHDRKNH